MQNQPAVTEKLIPLDLDYECMVGDTLVFTDNRLNPTNWYGFSPNAHRTIYTFIRFADHTCTQRVITFTEMPLIFLEMPRASAVDLPHLARANFIDWLKRVGIEI